MWWRPIFLFHFLFCYDIFVLTLCWSPPPDITGVLNNFYSTDFYSTFYCVGFYSAFYSAMTFLHLHLDGPHHLMSETPTNFYSTNFYSAGFYSTFYSTVTFFHLNLDGPHQKMRNKSEEQKWGTKVRNKSLWGPPDTRWWRSSNVYSADFYSTFYSAFFPLWPFCTYTWIAINQKWWTKMRNKNKEQKWATKMRNKYEEQKWGTNMRNKNEEQNWGTKMRNKIEEQKLVGTPRHKVVGIHQFLFKLIFYSTEFYSTDFYSAFYSTMTFLHLHLDSPQPKMRNKNKEQNWRTKMRNKNEEQIWGTNMRNKNLWGPQIHQFWLNWFLFGWFLFCFLFHYDLFVLTLGCSQPPDITGVLTNFCSTDFYSPFYSTDFYSTFYPADFILLFIPLWPFALTLGWSPPSNVRDPHQFLFC